MNKSQTLAVIRIRGKVKMNPHIRDSFQTLGLKNVNNCVILLDNPVNRGQIRAINDHVTWGEIEEATLKMLKEKRSSGKEQKVFRLHPPRKGWEDRGIIHSYKSGGAAGYRGPEINELVRRMVK